VATILLVGITVVGGTTVYVWGSEIFGHASGTALPTMESIQLLGYDARDTTNLTSLSTLDNGVSNPTSLVAGSEFMVLKVRNTTPQEITINKVIIIGKEHTWDSNAASATEAPSSSEFQVYQKLSGDPSIQKNSPSIASSEDARIAVKLSDSLPHDISLGRSVLVKIKTNNGSTFNFTVVTGTMSGASDSTSSGGSSGSGGGTCNGLSATIPGTANADVLTGTGGNDVITGLGGDDIINGGGGDDVICGGDGDDEIDAGSGNDVVYGGDGNDFIDGNSGDDTLYGEGGNDFLNGNSGTDTCNGGSGTDQLLNCEQ
jgi:hypothetical protein